MIYVDKGMMKIKGECENVCAELTLAVSEIYRIISDNYNEKVANYLVNQIPIIAVANAKEKDIKRTEFVKLLSMMDATNLEKLLKKIRESEE